MNIKRFLLLVTSYCLLVTLFIGCATAPPRTANFATYNINGTPYIPLVSLCQTLGIDWSYDTYTRSVHLSKGSHQMNLMVGQNLVMVDQSPMRLTSPVQIYKGTVVVPYRFKEQVIDSLYQETPVLAPVGHALLTIKKVVVDAGHGGNDPGAIGHSGLREKDVNLDIAKRLSNLLRSRGIDVVMTRSVDRFIPLPTRVEIANNSRADLFISIHSNASRVRSLSGFEVYYVSPNVGDDKRALASARSVPLNLAGCVVVSNSLDLKAILWDLFYTHSRAESVELCRSICGSMRRNLDVRLLGIKGARFEVLRGIRMPGVLVETGFVSNAEEERMLKNSFYRQKIAESLMQGIEEYARSVPAVEVVRR
jgi:N-acetylmuramoyl-L-alanine amidase